MSKKSQKKAAVTALGIGTGFTLLSILNPEVAAMLAQFFQTAPVPPIVP